MLARVGYLTPHKLLKVKNEWIFWSALIRLHTSKPTGATFRSKSNREFEINSVFVLPFKIKSR